MKYPDEFKRKMQNLLGEEYEFFEASYDKPRRRGLRVNEYKISAEEFAERFPFLLERIPWVKNGFFYEDDVRPARHPYYAAGLYYLQEPSAMTPASRLPLEAGDRVLDLCAAPGGKATELASRLAVLDEKNGTGRAEGNVGGILIANDISQPRAKALLHNLEMTGTQNYCVLNETPERLAGAFPEFFDKILVDAPCSGEGMFRKEEEALRLWCPERVAEFARQQKMILSEAYRMLRPGGMLLYSTCTFSPEENEQQIANFLKAHPDMELQEIGSYEGFAPGREDWVQDNDEGVSGCVLQENDPLHISRCVRIWPYKMDGEGHFLALMEKNLPVQDVCGKSGNPDAEAETGDYLTAESVKQTTGKKKQGAKRKKQGVSGKKKAEILRPDREQLQLLRVFLYDIVGNAAEAERICRAVEMRQEKAFLPAVSGERLSGLHVMRGGVYLGDWKKNRFEPSQAWAMTQKAETLGRVIVLPADDPDLTRFLSGETITSKGMDDGWVLIVAEQYPVGWGKVVRGMIKNHYPVSWRIPGNGQR